MKRLSIATIALCSLVVSLVAHAADAVPSQQQAAVQTGSGGLETVKVQSIPVLRPGPGQVLIRVYAAALNPADWGQLERPSSGATAQRVLGTDLSGVIVAAGSDTTGRAVGMPVFAMTDRGSSALNGAFSQ